MTSDISLRNYLSRHFGAVAVLPVIAIAFLTWCFMMPAIKNRTIIAHQAMARSIADQLRAHLLEGERQISALAEYLGSQPV